MLAGHCLCVFVVVVVGVLALRGAGNAASGAGQARFADGAPAERRSSSVRNGDGGPASGGGVERLPAPKPPPPPANTALPQRTPAEQQSIAFPPRSWSARPGMTAKPEPVEQEEQEQRESGEKEEEEEGEEQCWADEEVIQPPAVASYIVTCVFQRDKLGCMYNDMGGVKDEKEGWLCFSRLRRNVATSVSGAQTWEPSTASSHSLTESSRAPSRT